MRDAPGLTSDQVYRWRLLLEEYRPKIVHVKWIHNTIADAISWLEFDPTVNLTAESYFMAKANKSSKQRQGQNWMEGTKYWCELKLDTNKMVQDSGTTNCHQLTIPNMGKSKKITCNNYTKEADTTFDKSSA
jgi:hypothetical protein